MHKLLIRMGVAAILVGPQLTHAAEKLTFVLPAAQFLPSFTPHNIALIKGYYKEEGLDVQFEAVRGGTQVATRLASGEGDLGGGTVDTIIQSRCQGTMVRAVALLGGGAFSQLVMRKDRAIYRTEELKGKRISVPSLTDTSYYALLGFLNAVGLNRKDVDILPAGPVGVYQAVLEDKADAMAASPDYWIPPFYTKGIAIWVIKMGQFFPNMTQVVIATDRHLKERPEAIRAFVRATLRGVTYVMSDPGGAAELVAARFRDQYPDPDRVQALRDVIDYYVRNIYPGQSRPGEMNQGRLMQLQDFYVKERLVDRETSLKDLYTNDYLP